MTDRYLVTLNISGLSETQWDEWCEADPVDGIDYEALQSDHLEHWRVEATSLEAARERVEHEIGDDPVTIVDIRPVTIDAVVSKAFRAAFESHPARATDPALALDSARETASELVPDSVFGSFDDETLTFRSSPRSVIELDGYEWTAQISPARRVDGPELVTIYRDGVLQGRGEWLDDGAGGACIMHADCGSAEVLDALSKRLQTAHADTE